MKDLRHQIFYCIPVFRINVGLHPKQQMIAVAFDESYPLHTLTSGINKHAPLDSPSYKFLSRYMARQQFTEVLVTGLESLGCCTVKPKHVIMQLKDRLLRLP